MCPLSSLSSYPFLWGKLSLVRKSSDHLIICSFWNFHSSSIWCISFSSFLQAQLSPWGWYSSWYLFSAHHTHLSMNMCSAPFAGKQHSLLCHLKTLTTHKLMVHIYNDNYFWCLSSLVEDCPQGLKDCRNPTLGLEEFLRQRSRELQGKEESQVIPMSLSLVRLG